MHSPNKLRVILYASACWWKFSFISANSFTYCTIYVARSSIACKPVVLHAKDVQYLQICNGIPIMSNSNPIAIQQQSIYSPRISNHNKLYTNNRYYVYIYIYLYSTELVIHNMLLLSIYILILCILRRFGRHRSSWKWCCG